MIPALLARHDHVRTNHSSFLNLVVALAPLRVPSSISSACLELRTGFEWILSRLIGFEIRTQCDKRAFDAGSQLCQRPKCIIRCHLVLSCVVL